MRMNTKQQRIDIQKEKSDLGFIQETSYEELIYPWKQIFSKELKKNIFVNQETSEQQESLPQEIKMKVEMRFNQTKLLEQEVCQRNYQSFLNEQFLNKQIYQHFVNWQNAPAKLQNNLKENQHIAYEELDYQYNIWYDKRIQDQIIKEREGSKTRLNPFLDCGFTKADISGKNDRFFCIHFVKGNCLKGENCSYKHHIPQTEEILFIDPSKDVFGRERFNEHRKDLSGTGSYQDSSWTLKFSNFILDLKKENYVMAGYEMLWWHISPYGKIDEIFLFPIDNIAYVVFEHWCIAEFVKEALINQSFDNNEVIMIQWVIDNKFNLDQKKQKQLEESLFMTDWELQKLDWQKKIRKIEDYELEQQKMAQLEKKLQLKKQIENVQQGSRLQQLDQRIKVQQNSSNKLKSLLSKIQSSKSVHNS